MKTSDEHDPNRNIGNPDNAPLREHVFDGIEEFDNRLPNWWLMTFYGAIAFSIVYWFVYHISEIGMSPEAKLAYRQELSAAYAAESGGNDFSDARLLEMSLDADLVGSAQAAYATNCAACHGIDATGGIGPDLTSSDWIHGGLPTQIHQVINEGVAAKGMPAWGSILGESRTAELTAYIISLNPDGFAPASSNASASSEAAAEGGS